MRAWYSVLMRTLFLALAAILITLAYGFGTSAQTSASSVFTANLSLGSSGAQVAALQRILNRDADTRIASTGPGSPGNETVYFGLLTKAAVVRFQEKYAGEILSPAALTHGNGYVGSYTRAKLNALSVPVSAASAVSANPPVTRAAQPATATTTAPIAVAASPVANYLVNDSEKIDIYSGDAMIENVRSKIYAAINSAIASQSTATIALPTITPADMPSVVIGTLSPQSGTPGTRVSVQGDGISTNSVVYFGNKYIVRAISRGTSGNFSFAIPPISPARYDVAVRTGNTVSNTAIFVITDSKNPPVHIQSISPSAIPYGGMLTITGSGFSHRGNTVVTTYQKFTDVSSPDGKTLVIRLTPDALRESAKIGDGTKSIPVSLYVVNDYGFSDSTKSFTMTI